MGINVPTLRQAVKKFQTVALSDIEKLLASKYHEVRLFALLSLVTRFSRVDDDKEVIYRLYVKNIHYVNNWDLVDSSAHYIMGAYLATRDQSLLDTLSQSDSLWERRIAIVATFYFIKNQQFNRTLAIAKQLLNDKEDLIHKAVGWMLREVGKRDIATEKAFLKIHYKIMPRTMLRYAIEKFSKEERKRYLQGSV